LAAVAIMAVAEGTGEKDFSKPSVRDLSSAPPALRKEENKRPLARLDNNRVELGAAGTEPSGSIFILILTRQSRA
jgi:hypothetical protein